MKKYVAYCKSHNWEGMRRDDELEAELDLKGHIELYPSEDHNNSGISAEEVVDKNLQFDETHKPGSTHANCDRNGCRFHRGVDTFTAGKDGVRVKVKVYADNVRVVHVTLKSISGGRDYRLPGKEVTDMSGANTLVDKGKYKIETEYQYVDTGGARRLTLFVHW